jgi:uncharacterized protein (TIGR03067 family)
LSAALALGGAVVLPGLWAAPAPVPRKDEDSVVGTFTVVVLERNGVKASAAELKTMKVIQTKEKWTFHINGMVIEGVEKFDPKKKPKQVDSTYLNTVWKGRTVQGIYEVRGDRLKYCWAPFGKARPGEFSAGPGSGRTMLVLKRVKR